MDKGKKWIMESSVLMGILCALTILFVVLKQGETDIRKLHRWCNDAGMWLVVIWQIVLIIICAIIWIKVLKDVANPGKTILRCTSLGVTCLAIIFLAGSWLNLVFDYNYGNVVLQKSNLYLIKTEDDYGGCDYSVWSKSSFFYRRLEHDIGNSADSVAEGIFYSYVNAFKDNTGVEIGTTSEDSSSELSEQMKKEYQYLNDFIAVTEDTFPERFQRGLYWEEKACNENSIGRVQVPIIDENGMQDLTWFCENICGWLESCLEEVPYENAPWLYKEVVFAMPSLSDSFDPSPYISSGYDHDSLYEAIYDFVDKKLTSADYPKHKAYGMLEFVDDGSDEFFPSVEPECSYTTKDGVTYGMLLVDRAGGSSYYSLVAYQKGEKTPVMVNRDPYNGCGGQAEWITFIDDSNLGFSCLSYNGGDDALLYRTEDGGKSFTQINYPSAKVKLSDGTIYNPFVIPEKVWLEDGSLFMLAGQSPWSGDYYSEELGKHPSGLYMSHDDGMSFEYVGEQ